MPCDLVCLVLGRSASSDLIEFAILKQSVSNARMESSYNEVHVVFLQTARQFLQLLEYDGHVKVRKFLRARPPAPPGLLGHLIKLKPAASMKPTFGSHYYANCTSGTLL